MIPRVNEQYTHGGVSYPVVHWIPLTMEDILEGVDEQEAEFLRQSGVEIFGFFDFIGLLAPVQFAEQSRGSFLPP